MRNKIKALFSNRLWLTHVLIAGVIFLIFSLAGLTGRPRALMETLELKGLDIQFKLRGERETSGHVVIAGIEARGIEAYGRWPWPRSVFTRLIVRLKESGAKTIVFDLLFSEPEENRVTPVLSSLKESFHQLGLHNDQFHNQIFYDELTQALDVSDNDGLLAEAVSFSGNVIMGEAFEISRRSSEKKFTAKALLDTENQRNLLMPIAVLRESAHSLGYVNIFPDSDGTIRRMRPMMAGEKSPYFALSVAAAAHFLEAEPQLDPEGFIVLKGHRIPHDKEGNILLDFYGLDRSFDRLSIADIIDGRIPPSRLRDKVVVIGSLATGIGDIWPTPLSSESPGIFIHATAIDNILENRLLRWPDHKKWALAGSIFAMVALPLGITALLFPLRATLACAVLMTGYVGVAQYLFQSFQMAWPLILPLGASAATILSFLIFDLGVEGRQHRWLRKSFAQYLSPDVIDILVRNPDQLRLGGEEKELTVIMADIRNFTTLSERLSPMELTRFLNHCLGELTDIILENSGTLDKYMGDAVMAFFGAPLNDPNHAVKGCLSAIRMCRRLHELRKEWIQQGLPDIQIGVGVSSGPMVVGNIGSTRRFDYSVIGDNVNLASRLEGLSKVYGVEIVIPDQTRNRLDGQFACRELDTVRVKGRETSVRIFELLDKDNLMGGNYDFVDSFEQGLAAYRRQAFADAIGLFEKTISLKPEDPPSQLFIHRCRILLANPVNKDWDSIWTFSQK